MKSEFNIFIKLCSIFVCVHIYGGSKIPLENGNCITLTPTYDTVREDISEPYKSLAHLPLNMGSCLFRKENQDNLEQFIKAYNPKTIIEVGSFLGVSAIFMASLMAKDGKLYAIDIWIWNGKPYYSDANDENIGNITLKTYEQFLSNVKHYDLTNIIIPIQMDSIEASHQLDVFADLIYIDGGHSEAGVYNDIIHWHPKLSKTGIICGDDWGFESVKNAVTRAAKEFGKDIKIDGNFWYFAF